MNKEDMANGWERLKSVYSQMPDFNPSVVKEWHKVLQYFTGSDFDEAISEWISKERYKPTPADMARLCRKAQRVRERNELAAEIAEKGECPYCGGLGYIGHFLEPEERDRYFYCICATSPDREKGAEILHAALNDGGWVFDKVRHGFTRRRAWVGDDRPMGQAAQTLLDQAGRKIGGRI